MEDTDEFKWAVKVVIKRQMRDLMEQLRERGEEIAILTVNLEDNSCSHFGSPSGEWFVSEQKNLTQNFLNFCQTKGKDRRTGYTPSYSYYTPKPTSGKKLAGFKQKTTPASTLSSDMPLVKVTVPRHLAGDITEEELAGLVGRIVATHLAMQEKGDGSTGGTKFDLLLEAANQYKAKEELSSVQSTPSTRSARRRKVTARYKEGMSSLKKGKKSEEEDETSEQEIGHDEGSVIFNILAELSTAILKRVKVRTTDESAVDVEHSTLTTSDKFESLAVQIIQELDEVGSGQLVNKKMIKVDVTLSKSGSKVKIDLAKGRSSRQQGIAKLEDMDDSDMEYLDSNIVAESDEDEQEYPDLEKSDEDYDPADDDGDSDMEIDSKEFFKTEQVSGTVSGDGSTLKKKKPKKKSLSEVTRMKCDQCNQVLTGISSLRAHVRRMHLREKSHLCHICEKGFYSTTHRDHHFASVHCKTCIKCGENVTETEKWNENIDKFTERTIECKCGEKVTMVTKLGRVRQEPDTPMPEGEKPKRKRPLIETTPHPCETCGLVLTGRSSLFAHYRRMHLKKKNHKCLICLKEFFSSTHLESHMLALHTRRCQNCQEFVIEKEPWDEFTDRWKERKVLCKCGASVSIVTKLGRKSSKPDDGASARKKKKKSADENDTRYVCGTCGKMFVERKNAMMHVCFDRSGSGSKENLGSVDLPKTSDEQELNFDSVTKSTSVNVTKPNEGTSYVIEEDSDSQVVMFQDETGNQNIQIMHDGKLVPAEQIIDEDGTVSLIIKHVE